MCSPTVELVLCRSPIFAAVTCRQSAPDFPRERGDSQEGGNRRCLPSVPPPGRRTPRGGSAKNFPPVRAQHACGQFEYPAQPVQKRSRPLGANTLTQFASPGQPVPKNRLRGSHPPGRPIPRKRKRHRSRGASPFCGYVRPLSSSSCRNYRSRRRYYHHRYRRNRSRRCPDRSIPRSG